MVRHEAAEALGAIASDECYELLRGFVKDEQRVVRESCEVALDVCDYFSSDQFEYCDSLSSIQSQQPQQSQ
jgi:deoxyhypusine monooxygenase